jgi:glycerol-3-phosphate acyltransferase PlsY
MIAGLYIAVLAIGYVIGSIPCGVMLGKIFAKTDITEVGSGKTGATNVLRAAGKKAAGLSLILDLAKGAGAVLLAGVIFNSDAAAGAGATPLMTASAQVLAAMAAVSGHSWSVFLKFKGGRGVATFIGSMLALYWPAGVVGGAIVVGVGLISRYMSLGSITGAVAAYITLIGMYIAKSYPAEYLIYTIYAMIGAIFIFFKHRDNITRLVSGKERRVGEKAGADKNPARLR